MSVVGTKLPFRIAENLADAELLIGSNRTTTDLQYHTKTPLEGVGYKTSNTGLKKLAPGDSLALDSQSER